MDYMILISSSSSYNTHLQEASKHFVDIDPNKMMEISSSDYGLILQLWRDDAVCKECYSRRREFQLSDSAK